MYEGFFALSNSSYTCLCYFKPDRHYLFPQALKVGRVVYHDQRLVSTVFCPDVITHRRPIVPHGKHPLFKRGKLKVPAIDGRTGLLLPGLRNSTHVKRIEAQRFHQPKGNFLRACIVTGNGYGNPVLIPFWPAQG